MEWMLSSTSPTFLTSHFQNEFNIILLIILQWHNSWFIIKCQCLNCSPLHYIIFYCNQVGRCTFPFRFAIFITTAVTNFKDASTFTNSGFFRFWLFSMNITLMTHIFNASNTNLSKVFFLQYFVTVLWSQPRNKKSSSFVLMTWYISYIE